jgi:hypothetical protein
LPADVAGANKAEKATAAAIPTRSRHRLVKMSSPASQ